MRIQQVSVNIWQMIYTAVTYLILAAAVWVFLRLIHACFWLPNTLRRQREEMEKMLESLPKEYQDMAKEIKADIEAEDEKDKNIDDAPEEKKIK